MPIELFASIFVVCILVSFTFLGKFFRKKQHTTDFELGFERDKKTAMIYRVILESQARGIMPSDPQYNEIHHAIDYLKRIECGNV